MQYLSLQGPITDGYFGLVDKVAHGNIVAAALFAPVAGAIVGALASERRVAGAAIGAGVGIAAMLAMKKWDL